MLRQKEHIFILYKLCQKFTSVFKVFALKQCVSNYRVDISYRRLLGCQFFAK